MARSRQASRRSALHHQRAHLGLVAGEHYRPHRCEGRPRPLDGGGARQQRIEQLLDTLAADSSSRFVRNATAYSGADAARFLRAKWRAQGQDIASAEAFVERIARRSGTTGRPYRVCAPGGECVDASVHLRALLAGLAVPR